MRRHVASAACMVVVASTGVVSLSAAPAQAKPCTDHISGPNDPGYAPSERSGSGSYNVEEWYLYDCIPQSAPNATDPRPTPPTPQSRTPLAMASARTSQRTPALSSDQTILHQKYQFCPSSATQTGRCRSTAFGSDAG